MYPRSHEIAPFQLTRHAEGQAQKRGIRPEVLGLILTHGDLERHAGEGLLSLQISRKRFKRLAFTGVPATLREKAIGVVLLIDPAALAIVTAMHALGRQGRRYSTQFPTRSRKARASGNPTAVAAATDAY